MLTVKVKEGVAKYIHNCLLEVMFNKGISQPPELY